jgi:hypothetical protein
MEIYLVVYIYSKWFGSTIQQECETERKVVSILHKSPYPGSHL